jgi:hypothetical protein
VPRESVVELPLKVEEAMRLLVSGGVIAPGTAMLPGPPGSPSAAASAASPGPAPAPGTVAGMAPPRPAAPELLPEPMPPAGATLVNE